MTVIRGLLARPDVTLVHLRNVGYGCYNFAVRMLARGGVAGMLPRDVAPDQGQCQSGVSGSGVPEDPPARLSRPIWDEYPV